MKKDYSNLKNKTFLDFTNDEKIVEEILGGRDAQEFLSSITEWGRCTTFAALAEITEDEELDKEIGIQFEHLFNE